MISIFKRYLALLSLNQRKWLWLMILTIILVTIARIAFHTAWLKIFIVLSFFAFKELFEYGRTRANSNAEWKYMQGRKD
jgi:predicted CDP-diglyceride synthetase/phosphatidate cytidylyltransferase